MRFRILPRADAIRQRARALMEVHPEMIGDVLHCGKKKRNALPRECRETYGELAESLVLRLTPQSVYKSRSHSKPRPTRFSRQYKR